MPKLPTGGNKRKMPDAPTPEMLKRMRLDAETSEPAAAPPKAHKTTVVDVPEDEDADADGDATMADRDFAPGGDADYFAEEDDEGRFFGGGLTSQQKDILDLFDAAGGEGALDDVRAPCPRPAVLTAC
jgi:beta-catenin-like protein 1